MAQDQVKGIEAGGLNRLAADLNGEAVQKEVERVKRRCSLSDVERRYLMSLARRTDGDIMLAREVEHLRVMSYFDGRHDALLGEAPEQKDDATLPLFSVGPSGIDGEYQHQGCPKCGEPMQYEPATTAGGDEPHLVEEIPATWGCDDCSYIERAEKGASDE
jgi:hypothetical protein